MKSEYSIMTTIDIKKYLLVTACLISMLLVIPPMCSSPIKNDTIKMVLTENNGNIENLDSPKNPRNIRKFNVSAININYGDTLEIPKIGKLGIQKNIFLDYSTKMIVKKAGNYFFRITSDDGFRLTIDGKIVSEHPENRPFTPTLGNIFLDKGEHLLTLNYYQGYGPMGLEAMYSKNKNGLFTYIGKNSSDVKFKLAN